LLREQARALRRHASEAHHAPDPALPSDSEATLAQQGRHDLPLDPSDAIAIELPEGGGDM
jgi:hypothetical protein